MPANFRDVITKENDTNIIIYKSLTQKCLIGCTNLTIEKMQESIEKMDPFSPEREAFETAIFAESVSLEIDKDGRVNIPKQYTQFANISSNALFAGKGKTFEIWNPEDYEQHSKKSREFAIKNTNLIK